MSTGDKGIDTKQCKVKIGKIWGSFWLVEIWNGAFWLVVRLLPLGAPPYNPLLSLKRQDLGHFLIGREQFHHQGAPRGYPLLSSDGIWFVE